MDIPGMYLAYIDPSAGGFLLQIVLGGLAGVAVIVKLQWRRIRALFARAPRDPEPPRS